MATSNTQMTGPRFIYLGLGLCALALVIIALTGGEPSGGRAETLAIFGIPGGVVCIVIGIIMMIRERRRRPTS